jgi:hypothetical protein
MKTPAALKSKSGLVVLLAVACAVMPACQATTEAQPWIWSEPAFAGIPDPVKLSELSGLTRSNSHTGVFWAINDGSNPAEIIAINAKAEPLAAVSIASTSNIDWEDITSYSVDGRKLLAIADTGDNGGVRSELFIHILEEPANLQAQSIKPLRSLRFIWNDGPRDTEALFASGEKRMFYLISKKRVPAELYALPFDAEDGSSPALLARLHGIAQPDAKTLNGKGDYGRYRAQITGADLSPDGRIFAVLNYQQIYFYALPEKPVSAIEPIASLTLPWLPQAEGIAFSQDGMHLFIGSEQAPTPIIRFDRIAP